MSPILSPSSWKSTNPKISKVSKLLSWFFEFESAIQSNDLPSCILAIWPLKPKIRCWSSRLTIKLHSKNWVRSRPEEILTTKKRMRSIKYTYRSRNYTTVMVKSCQLHLNDTHLVSNPKIQLFGFRFTRWPSDDHGLSARKLALPRVGGDLGLSRGRCLSLGLTEIFGATRCWLNGVCHLITSLRVIPTVTSYWHIFVTNPDILWAKIWRGREGEDNSDEI